VFAAMLRGLRREARAGRALPFAVVVDGRLAGQVTVSTVVRGAFESAAVGYWVDQRVAGRGVMPTALALVADHCFGPVGLHRLEANVRPENAASLRVVDKLGFRAEGLHRRLLFIDEDWRDHLCHALLAQDVPEGVLRRYLANRPG
jgi:ribosomal-protein-alanine N-acetyltransferase